MLAHVGDVVKIRLKIVSQLKVKGLIKHYFSDT